jgi:CelD/BcsL family acetyltransferase involved in cellulose biosynthesis
MMVYRLDPLQDPRWAALVQRHRQASVFHTPGWLEALQRTYGFEPVAFTTSAPQEALSNGIVFCDVRSWLTGRRLVSLPFSDHCDPLVDDADQFAGICGWLEAKQKTSNWRYIELRPQRIAPPAGSRLRKGEQYLAHVLDLRPEADQLFRSFHKDSIQRKIRRAEREGVVDDEGRGEELLRTFYRLLVLTRRRHQLPPQPFQWFRNLAGCMGPAMTVRIASHRGQPVAGVVMLRHRDTMVYKYGASDAAFHRLGGMQLLFWKTILAARAQGCVAFDLGRSDVLQDGLLAFKDRWAATRTPLIYWSSPAPRRFAGRLGHYVTCRVRQIVSLAPDGLRAAASRLLYKHAG